MIRRLFFLMLIVAGLVGVVLVGKRVFVRPSPLQQATAKVDANDPYGAQPILRTLMRTEPRNVDAHVLLARSQLMTSDWVAAEKEIKIARALKYDRVTLTPMLARTYLMQEKYQELLVDIPASGASPDEVARNMVLRSMAYLGLGDLTRAQTSLDQATRSLPDDPGVLMQGARLALARKDVTNADRLATAALAQDPRNVDALLLRSDVAVQRWDNSRALGYLNEAVEQAPYSPYVRMQRATLNLKLGQDRLVQEDVDAVFDLGPRDTSQPLFFNAMLMMRAKKYADAGVEFDKLGPAMEQYPKAFFYRAAVAMELGQTQTARESLDRLLRLTPTDVDGVRLAAEVELKSDRPDKAAALVVRAVDAGLKDPPSHNLLGRAYFILGRRAEALEQFRIATVMAPENREFKAHLAAAQAAFGTAGAPTPFSVISPDAAPGRVGPVSQ